MSNKDRRSTPVDIQSPVHLEKRGALVPVAPPEVTQGPSDGSGAGSDAGSGAGSGGGSGSESTKPKD